MSVWQLDDVGAYADALQALGELVGTLLPGPVVVLIESDVDGTARLFGGMRCLSRSRFSAMVLFWPPESRVGGSQPSSQARMVGDAGFSLNSQRPEASEKRVHGVPAQGQRIMNEQLSPAQPRAYGQHRPVQAENGGREESRLRNHRRRVEGSATRSGSLTVGAASSQQRPSRKYRWSARLRAMKL